MINWDAVVTAPCMAVFGEEQKPTYAAPGGGAPVEIDGIFDDAYTALIMAADGDPEIAATDPVIGVRLAQFPALPLQGGRLTLPRLGVAYRIIDVRPDGKGWAKLILTLAAD